MAAAGESAAAKQLRIKTGVVTRLEKELLRYHEEHAAQTAKVEAMRASGAEEHSIKKQVSARWREAWGMLTQPTLCIPHPGMQIEVLGETETVIPDTIRRLEKAVEDLREAVVRRRCALSSRFRCPTCIVYAGGGSCGPNSGGVCHTDSCTRSAVSSWWRWRCRWCRRRGHLRRRRRLPDIHTQHSRPI